MYLNRSKIKQYFEKKGLSDFKNSKKFWQFYKSSVKLESDKCDNDGPNLIIKDNIHYTQASEIASLFNSFFTSIKSVSISTHESSVQFIESHFNKLKKDYIFNTSITSIKGFSFRRVNTSEVSELLSSISNLSSAGS